MSDKHYHNDYKKLIGLDQTRTASQKLLDRAIGKRQSTLPVVKIDSQPKKKVKRQAQEPRQVKVQQVIGKIVKVLTNRNNIDKIQKSLSILNKCLNQKQFIEQLNEQKIKSISQCLIGQKTVPQASLNQLIKLCQIQEKCLKIVDKIIEQKYSQSLDELLKKIQLQRRVMKIITDDSFSFNKQLLNFKKILFQFFKEKKEKQLQKVQGNNSLCTYLQVFVFPRLFNLPNIHLEWAKSGMSNLFKQFIGQFKDQLQDSKKFLQEYNKFISQKKKSSHNTTSYDILGSNKTNGATYTVVQQFDSTNAWCNRQ